MKASTKAAMACGLPGSAQLHLLLLPTTKCVCKMRCELGAGEEPAVAAPRGLGHGIAPSPPPPPAALHPARKCLRFHRESRQRFEMLESERLS